MIEETLDLLAAPPERQQAWLRDNGLPTPEELLLQFDDDLALLPGLREDGALSPMTFDLLGRVDAQFSLIEEMPDMWSLEALSGPPWRALREKARAALQSLRVPA